MIGYTGGDYEVNYRAGQVTTLNVTVKEEGLEVMVENNMDWGQDGATGNGSIEIP